MTLAAILLVVGLVLAIMFVYTGAFVLQEVPKVQAENVSSHNSSYKLAELDAPDIDTLEKVLVDESANKRADFNDASNSRRSRLDQDQQEPDSKLEATKKSTREPKRNLISEIRLHLRSLAD